MMNESEDRISRLNPELLMILITSFRMIFHDAHFVTMNPEISSNWPITLAQPIF